MSCSAGAAERWRGVGGGALGTGGLFAGESEALVPVKAGVRSGSKDGG